MSAHRSGEIWIVGATGNIGRALAARLTATGSSSGSSTNRPGVVLVGRSAQRLDDLVATLDGPVRTLVLAGFDEMLEAVRSERPSIVVNLLGSYAETAIPLARACMPDGGYVDLTIDNETLAALVGLNDEAATANTTVVGGAGFGVVATEALVARSCAEKPEPVRVRIDALSSYAPEDGVVGEAFAVTSVDVMTIGGRAYRDGRLTRVGLGSNLTRHVLPDGTTVSSSAVASGELFAARSISHAATIDFTSALAPTSPLIRASLPMMSRLLRIPAMRRMMIRQLAAAKTTKAPRPRPYSWGHAVVEWRDGSRRESWLRAEDAMDYTRDVVYAVVRRLIAGTAPVGAFTPAAGFGPGIAEEAGATFVDAAVASPSSAG